MEAGKPGKANLRNKESVESSLSFFSPPFVTLISGFFFSRYPDRLLMLVSFAIKTQLKAPNAPNYNAFQCFFFHIKAVIRRERKFIIVYYRRQSEGAPNYGFWVPWYEYMWHQQHHPPTIIVFLESRQNLDID